MIRCGNRNVRDAVFTTSQHIFLISFIIVSVNSWVLPVVQKVHFSYPKSSHNIVAQCKILARACSMGINTLGCSRCRPSSSVRSTSEAVNFDFTDNDNDSLTDTINVQWHLLCKHHALCDKLDIGVQSKTTTWVGKWSTYDYVGDIVLETMPASANYISTSTHPTVDSPDRIDVTHTISTGSTSSDCETCFDDPNSLRTIPITTYTPDNIDRKCRLGACGMVVGPSILRSSGTSKSNIYT
jgi:hypothetical protein